MAKKKKVTKARPKEDRSMSPLDFLEDECIGIMSESDENSREALILPEFIKKEPVHINIQNVAVEPMHTLKKYLKNLRVAANVIKIEIEDDEDIKDPLFINDYSKELIKETRAKPVENNVIEIKQEALSGDELDEGEDICTKKSFDKMISKRFNIQDSFVMIPRDIPITPSTNTATFFLKLPMARTMEPSVKTEPYFETQTPVRIDSDNEVEDEINKASFKNFLEGIEDPLFTDKLGHSETKSKFDEKIKCNVDQSNFNDSLISAEASVSQRQSTSERKKKKRRKEMFVFTNEKAAKSKPIPSSNGGSLSLCMSSPEESYESIDLEGNGVGGDLGEKNKIPKDAQSVDYMKDTKDINDMTEEEIVGHCVDEIDFSSLVEDVQEVIRHLEETEMKVIDRPVLAESSLMENMDSGQNLENQQTMSKEIQHSKTEDVIEKGDPCLYEGVTTKQNCGKELKILSKKQLIDNSSLFRNYERSEEQNNPEQDTDSPEFDRHDNEMEDSETHNMEGLDNSLIENQNIETEGNGIYLVKNLELGIKEIIPNEKVITHIKNTEKHPPLVESKATDNMKEIQDTCENACVSEIKGNVECIGKETPVIKLTIVTEKEASAETTNELEEDNEIETNVTEHAVPEAQTTKDDKVVTKNDKDLSYKLETESKGPNKDKTKGHELKKSQGNIHNFELNKNDKTKDSKSQSKNCGTKESEKAIMKPELKESHQDKLDDDHYSDIDVLLLSESEEEGTDIIKTLLKRSSHVPIPIKIEPEVCKPKIAVIPVYENITDSECEDIPTRDSEYQKDNTIEPVNDKEKKSDIPTDETHILKEIFNDEENDENSNNRPFDEFDEIVNFTQGPVVTSTDNDQRASLHKQSPSSLPSTSNVEEIQVGNVVSKSQPVYDNRISINESIFNSEYAVPSTSKTPVTSIKNDLGTLTGFQVPDRGKSSSPSVGKSSEKRETQKRKKSPKKLKEDKESRGRPKSRITNMNKVNFLDETPLSTSTESSRAPTPIPIPNKKESKKEKRDYEKDYRKQKEKVKEQEKLLTTRKMKITTLGKSLVKLEKKVVEKRSETVKMEAEIRDFKKEIDKSTKKCSELVSKKEEKEKVMDNMQNDLAIKQQRIIKLEHMLKKKTVPPPNKDDEVIKQLQSELSEKQKQTDELEAFLQGKDASVQVKTDRINQLENESTAKDRQIFTLECLIKEKEKSFHIEKSQNFELQRKNDQLEKYVLQKTHIKPAKSNSDLEVQVKSLETQVKDLQNEKVSWIKQNTKLSEFEALCKALQTKNKDLQTSLSEKEQISSKVQEASVDHQRIANLELQNSDLMSQVKHVSLLQRRIRDLEDKLKIEFSNPEGEEASDADKLAALPLPSRNLPLNFLTRETPLFDAYSRTPYNRTIQTPRLLSGLKSSTENTDGHIDAASGSFATSDLITKLMKMRPVVPPPPINIDITKPPPPNIDLVRPDSEDDASQISLPPSSVISNPPPSTESAPSVEGTPTVTGSTNPLGLQKFSTLCSGSFNVSQTHWSDDSNDEDEQDNDITDGLLNIGGQRSSGTQEESEIATPRHEDLKLIPPPLDDKTVIESAVPNPMYNPFDQREDDIRPEVDESMCINQPGVEYHESHNASDDKHNLNLSIENDKKGILDNEQFGDNEASESQPLPPEQAEEVKREIIADILDIQIKRKELREKLNTSAESISDVPEPIENENDEGEPSKKDKTKKKKKHGHDKKKKHKKHKKEGKHKKKKREKEKEKTETEKVRSTLLKDTLDFDDDFLQLEPDISDLLDLALSDDELTPLRSRKDRVSSSSDGEISSSPSPLREPLKSPTPNLDDLAELEERLKSLNSEANKALNATDETSILNQEETRIVKKLSVDDVFNVLSDISDSEIESPDKLKTGSPEKIMISPENKKLKRSNPTKRTITIKLDKNKDQEKLTSAQSTNSQVPESVDTRSLIEKAKEIRIECKNDQVASQQKDKPKFDDRETEQMLKDLHSCLPKKKDFKLSSIKVHRKRSPSPVSRVDDTFSRRVKRVKSLRKRSKSKEKDDDLKREKDGRRTKENGKDGKRSISKDSDHSHHNQDQTSPNDGSLARKLYDRIHRRSDSQHEFGQMDPPPPLKDSRDRSKSQSQDSKSTSGKRSSLERHCNDTNEKRPKKESRKRDRDRKASKSRSSERKSSYVKKEKQVSSSESKDRTIIANLLSIANEKKSTRSKSKERKHSRSRSRERKYSRSKSPDRKKRRPRRSPSRFTRRKRSRSRSKDRNRQAAQRIKNKYINEKIRNQRKNHENNMDTEENCRKRGVQLYWDYDTKQNRVRLDGYGANGPAEILVNMMAVDISIKVHFKTKCMTCGKDILGANKFKHFDNGVCSKKAKILQAGGVVFCSYCEITGAHWVEACPLLVSFCFSCWVWGHNYLHHHVADKGYLERLMRKFNEMRNWHHVNSQKTRDSRIIPMNELIPLTQDDVAIRYEGKQEDIDDIAGGIPCSTSRPACWLVKENWTNIYKILEKPGFEWVTNADGFCLKKLPDNTEQFLSQFHSLLPGNQMKEEEHLDYEYDESQEQEVEGDEEECSEEDDIIDWLDY